MLRRARHALLAASCLAPLGWIAASCTGEPRVARRAPRLDIAETRHDFGRVPQGTAVRHVFAVRNGGDLVLDVIRLRSAPDCAARLLGPSEVAAGGTAAIEAVFETDAVFGPERRTVTVYSNDPRQPAVVLALVGEVQLEAAARPAAAYVGTVQRGKRSAREVTIATAEGVRVESIEGGGPYIEIEALPARPPEDGAKLAIAAAPNAPLGSFRQEIRVRTSSPRFPLLVVPVTGTIAGGARDAG